MFFTPDGDLLDVSSDEDVSLNVNLSSISSSEGRTHSPFAQYAILGNSPDLTGARSVFTSSLARVKGEKISNIQNGGGSGDTGESANAGLFKAPGGVVGRGTMKVARQC